MPGITPTDPHHTLAAIFFVFLTAIGIMVAVFTYREGYANGFEEGRARHMDKAMESDTMLHLECIKVLGTWDYEGRRCTNSERRVRINPSLNTVQP